ncbi:hypothetical protein L1076_18535 [Vibrio sp. MMG022]|nr:hypothetical protein [Vibrio sp. MMG023]
MSGVPWSDLSMPAIVFAFTRMAHPVMYIADVAIGRTLVVIAGIASCVYMHSLAFKFCATFCTKLSCVSDLSWNSC